MIDAVDLGFYRHQGHLTVNGVFDPADAEGGLAADAALSVAQHRASRWTRSTSPSIVIKAI